jgi:hypothetical protein
MPSSGSTIKDHSDRVVGTLGDRAVFPSAAGTVGPGRLVAAVPRDPEDVCAAQPASRRMTGMSRPARAARTGHGPRLTWLALIEWRCAFTVLMMADAVPGAG